MKKFLNVLPGKSALCRICLLLVLYLACNVISLSQVENVNPDTTGTPWMTGGVPVVSNDWLTKISQIPDMVRSSTINPASSIDNSTNKFMRPIFYQILGSCFIADLQGFKNLEGLQAGSCFSVQEKVGKRASV